MIQCKRINEIEEGKFSFLLLFFFSLFFSFSFVVIAIVITLPLLLLFLLSLLFLKKIFVYQSKKCWRKRKTIFKYLILKSDLNLMRLLFFLQFFFIKSLSLVQPIPLTTPPQHMFTISRLRNATRIYHIQIKFHYFPIFHSINDRLPLSQYAM